MQVDFPGALTAFVLVTTAVTIAVLAGTAAARFLFHATEREEPRP